MKVHIHGNCQSFVLFHMLKEVCPDWDISFYEVHAEPIMQNLADYRALIGAADIVLSQPIHPGYRDTTELSLSWIRDYVKPSAALIVIPALHFSGHHPEFAALAHLGDLWHRLHAQSASPDVPGDRTFLFSERARAAGLAAPRAARPDAQSPSNGSAGLPRGDDAATAPAYGRRHRGRHRGRLALLGISWASRQIRCGDPGDRDMAARVDARRPSGLPGRALSHASAANGVAGISPVRYRDTSVPNRKFARSRGWARAK